MDCNNSSYVIAGAGVTGLTAAVELQKQGKNVVLLEVSECTGGMTRSFRMDGVVFDIGPHMLMFSPHRKCGAYLKHLLRNEEMYRRRYMFAVNDGCRNWQSPVTPIELLRYPSWARNDVFRCLLRRITQQNSIPTLEGYISRRSGERIYSTAFEPLVRKKLGIKGSALHENWWLRPPKSIRIRDHRSQAPSDGDTPQEVLGRIFHNMLPMYGYPKKGIGTVTDLLREQFTGRLITSCGDIGIIRSDERITGVSIKDTTISTSSLIWTAPVSDFYAAISEKCPVKTDTVSTRMVFITFRTDTLPKRQYLYTYHHGTKTVFNRVYYPRSIYRQDSPNGLEGFCFEIRLTDEIREITSDRLIDLTTSDALRTGIASGSIISARIMDVRNTSPLLSVAYLEREEALFGAVDRFSNLAFAGRQGNYCNCMIPGAVEQGILAAERITETHASL